MFLTIFQNTFCFPRTDTCNFFKLFFRSCIYLNFLLPFETAAPSCTCSFYPAHKGPFGLVPLALNLPFSYLPRVKTTCLLNGILDPVSFFHFIHSLFNNSPFHINYNYFFCSFVSDIFGLLFLYLFRLNIRCNDRALCMLVRFPKRRKSTIPIIATSPNHFFGKSHIILHL